MVAFQAPNACLRVEKIMLQALVNNKRIHAKAAVLAKYIQKTSEMYLSKHTVSLFRRSRCKEAHVKTSCLFNTRGRVDNNVHVQAAVFL